MLALGQTVPTIPMPLAPPGPDDTLLVTEFSPQRAPEGYSYLSLNPIDWAKSGGDLVWDGAKWVWNKPVKTVGGWAWDGGKWVWKKVVNPCELITTGMIPAKLIPGINGIVQKNGCSPRGRQLGALALSLYLNSQGVPFLLSQMIAQIGTQKFYDCICEKVYNPRTGQITPIQESSAIGTGGMIALGIGMLALGFYAFASTRQPTAADAQPETAAP